MTILMKQHAVIHLLGLYSVHVRVRIFLQDPADASLRG